MSHSSGGINKVKNISPDVIGITFEPLAQTRLPDGGQA